MVRSVRPTRLDRARGNSRVIVAMGPLPVASTSELSARLVALARVSVGNRLGIVRAGDGRDWYHDPHHLVDAVRDWSSEFPGTEHLSVPDKLAHLRAATVTPVGLRIYLSGAHLITDIPHAVFDGVMVVRLWLYLSVGQTDSVPLWATTPESRPRPARTLLRYLATHPRAVVPLARAGRRRVDATMVVQARAQDPIPRLRTRSARLSAARLIELHGWRDVHAPECSMAVILMTVLTRATCAAGVDLAPYVHVVVDGRRYDAALRDHLGNAAVGLNLTFGAPYRPSALQSELSGAIASGRPLAAMLAISVGEWISARRRRIATVPDSISAGPSVLSFSHLLGLDDMPDGQWLGGFDEHDFAALTEPVGPRGVAFLMPRMRDHYDLSASFDARHHDAAVIDDALRLATEDPLRLLDPAPLEGEESDES